MRFDKLLIILCMVFLVFNFASAEELIQVKVQLNWEHEVEFAGYYAAIE